MPNRTGQAYSTPQGQAYDRYINSSAWAKKRQQYWTKYGYSCKAVGCDVVTGLHVHHHTYERLGKEWLTDLIGLCEEHHHAVHDLYDRERPKVSLRRATEVVTGVSLAAKKKEAKKEPKKRVKRSLSALAEAHKIQPPKRACGCPTCKSRPSVTSKAVVTKSRTHPWEFKSNGGRYQLTGEEGVFKKDVGSCVCGKRLKRGDPVRVVRRPKGAKRAITGDLVLQKIGCC